MNTVALLVFCLVVGVTFAAATMATGVGEGSERRALPDQFAHSVVPIIVGYIVAHYLSYFVETGQQTLVLLSDPLARGDDLLGTAGVAGQLLAVLAPDLPVGDQGGGRGDRARARRDRGARPGGAAAAASGTSSPASCRCCS